MTFTITAIVGAAIAVTGAVVQGVAANNAAKREKKRAKTKEQQIEELEANRQEITNPYEDMRDLSSMITNPYANLQVATKAAELQGEEADISLASTLDTLRASGAGAGGATALAQAALRSKLGISANIEQQEAANARMRAQGQAQMNQQMMAEQQRLQQGDVAGKQFVFGAQEQREMQQLNRLSALQQGHMQAQAAYKTAAIGAIGQGAGAVGGAMMGMAGGGGAAGGATTGTGSDIRLKKNIKLIGLSPSGLRIYAFEYIDKTFMTKGTWQGVMSDEVSSEHVFQRHGYDIVDYSKLDVEFKQIKL